MAITFLSAEWLDNLNNKINRDARYAEIARNWEGDLCFVIEPGGPLAEKLLFYLDLWHGKCRKAEIIKELPSIQPKFVLTATYENAYRIMNGELDPMQAMMTRKLQVHGSMTYMMRNVPVVLDFVRCAREATLDTPS
jgi:putative sterol carrier protein